MKIESFFRRKTRSAAQVNSAPGSFKTTTLIKVFGWEFNEDRAPMQQCTSLNAPLTCPLPKSLSRRLGSRWRTPVYANFMRHLTAASASSGFSRRRRRSSSYDPQCMAAEFVITGTESHLDARVCCRDIIIHTNTRIYAPGRKMTMRWLIELWSKWMSV